MKIRRVRDYRSNFLEIAFGKEGRCGWVWGCDSTQEGSTIFRLFGLTLFSADVFEGVWNINILGFYWVSR